MELHVRSEWRVLDLTWCEARVLTGMTGLLVVMLVGCLHGIQG